MSQSIAETLVKAGFEPIVADIYLILINNGELSVPQILEHTTLSRASVYEALPELLAGGYIEYRKEGRQAFYKPAHPNQLASLVEQKKRDVALLDGEMGETIRALVGSYNLSSNKPGVRFFEGVDGAKELTMDTLHAKDTILTFLNPSEIHPSLNTFNEEYATERVKNGIPKKIIAPDTPENRLRYKTKKSLLEVKFFPTTDSPFRTSIQIYNNTVSFATLSIDKTIGILIEDEDIATFHKQVFEFIWQHGTAPIYQEPDSGVA
jgi:sugar-specific transcriptional regulator TrmB